MCSQASRNLAFNVTEHVIPCQHICGYPHSVKESSVALKLAVAKYVPKRAISSNESSVTIIAAHANGIVKVGTLIFQEQFPIRADTVL